MVSIAVIPPARRTAATAENYPVSFNHFVENLCKSVFAEYTVASALAGKASTAWFYTYIGQLNKLGFDSSLIQFLKYHTDYDCSIAILTCASVNANNFYVTHIIIQFYSR